MPIPVDLTDLAAMHPLLLWDEIQAATASVIRQNGREFIHLPIQVTSPADEIDKIFDFEISTTGISEDQIIRLSRTYERSRLIEMSAIAVAGIAVSQVLWFQIVDIALRGTGADYLIGPEMELLEVAARSHKADFLTAWNERADRLQKQWPEPAWLCVVEWETPSSRLEQIG